MNRFVKFLLVGVLNTLFGYAMFALFIYLGFHYTIASLFSTILGIMFNFQTIGKMVFGNKRQQLLFKFTGVYAVIYGLNVLGLHLFELRNINNYIAAAILAFPLAILSYMLNKNMVFKEERR